jgi:hypothetical protein
MSVLLGKEKRQTTGCGAVVLNKSKEGSLIDGHALVILGLDFWDDWSPHSYMYS